MPETNIANQASSGGIGGRTTELRVLHDALRSSSLAVVVRGIDGIGKTTLVDHFRAQHEIGRSIAFTVRDYLSLDEARNGTLAARRIAFGIAEELRVEGILPLHIRPEEVSEGSLVREALPAVCRIDLPRLVIVVDDLDLLEAATLRRVLRDFFRAAKLPKPPLFIAVIGNAWGAADVPAAEDDPRTVTIRLSRLSQAEMSDLAIASHADGKLGLPADPGEVWRATHGFPLLWNELVRLLSISSASAIPESLNSESLTILARTSGALGDRLRTAFASATAVARLALTVLARTSSLTRQELEDRIQTESVAAPTEVNACLESLLRAGLLEVDSGRVAIAPLLLGVSVSMLSADQPTGLAAEASGATFAAMRDADALSKAGNIDRAIERLRAALVLTASPIYEVHLMLARLLIERARTSEDATADLTDAEIVLRELPSGPDNSYRNSVRELLCRVLVRRALATASQKAEYRSICSEILELDPDLIESGADLVVARLEVEDWVRRFQATPAERLIISTRQLLRRESCWDLVAELLSQWLQENLDTHRDYTRARVLIKGIAHPLLEADAHKIPLAPFWPQLIRTVEFLGSEAPGDTLQVPGATWLALASSAPPSRTSELAQASRPSARRDFRQALLAGSGADAIDIVRAVAFLRPGGAADDVVDEVGHVIFDAIDDAGRRAALAESLGICLRGMLELWLPVTPAIAARVSASATMFFEATEADSIFVGDESHAAWYGLVAGLEDLRTGGGAAFLNRLHRTHASLSIDELTAEERLDLERLLDHAYEVTERTALSIPGLTTGITDETVQGYRILSKSENPETFLLRVFSLRGHDQAMVRVLRSLWDKERRTLATLSVTHGGRALTRFIDAHFDAETDRALLITEWPGTETLGHRLLRAPMGMMATSERQRLWGHLALLLESLQTLHRAGFIHRAITPSVIFVTSTADTLDARVSPGLKLGHFEWSVYLRTLSSMAPPLSRKLTRYIAPEALRAALDIEEGLNGESFGSDLYAIGLVLFECLVRPLSAAELDDYKTPQNYDEAAQIKHRTWLESLRDEIRNRSMLREGTTSLLTATERDILLSLVQFDLLQRPTSLDGVVKIATSLATLNVDVKGALILVTTLSRKEDGPPSAPNAAEQDPRRDPRCIAYRLGGLLPQIALVKNPRSELAVPQLTKIVQGELRGAAVYLNAQPGDFPLVLVSRSGIRFRVRPLEWGERETDVLPKPLDLHIGFLEVARRDDRPLEPPIAHLEKGVTLIDVKENAVNQARRDFRPGNMASWEPLFRIATDAHGEVRTLAESQRRRRVLANVLSLASAFEYEAVTEDVAFEPASSGIDDDQPFTVLRAADGITNLAERFAHISDEDSQFELANARTPIGRGLKVSLARAAFDTESGTITVPIAELALPPNGVIRPSASIGAEALHARRRRIFRQVEDDDFLLDALSSPGSGRYREGGRDRKSPIIDKLDKDKSVIADRFFRLEPLLVVQGPPATGKTSLAAEIILRTLDRVPNARILVTTQGHEPLDNLLERVFSEGNQNDKAKATLHEVEIVRIASGRRKKDSPTARQFYPHARAEALFQQIQTWSTREAGALGLVGEVARIVAKELAGYVSAPYSLQRRVQESANLVFATVNSQHIELGGSASYDLVIVEEAARCFPLEVAGAMRLSRRWLLIGDQQQLAPFAFGAIEQAFDKWVSEENAKILNEPNRDEAERWLRDVRDNFHRYLKLFEHLHSTDGPQHDTLRTQWRMHPFLGDLVSRAFYEGGAVRNPESAEELADLTRRRLHQYSAPSYVKGRQLIWVDVDHARSAPECAEHWGAGGMVANGIERRTLVALLRQMQTPKLTKDVAILTPYRSQAENLIGLLKENVNRFDAFGVLDDRVFTVDSFQGRQAGTIFLSLVRNNVHREPGPALGFLRQRQRATVMFSRAEKLLVIVGSLEHFKQFENTDMAWLGPFVQNAEIIPYRDILPQDEHRKGSERW